MRVKKPVNNRHLGIEFEKKCEEYLKTLGYKTCTPRATSRILGHRKGAFAIHLDFWGILDGLAYKNGTIIGWQCKRDFAKWSNNKKKALTNPLLGFKNESGARFVLVFYERAGLEEPCYLEVESNAGGVFYAM